MEFTEKLKKVKDEWIAAGKEVAALFANQVQFVDFKLADGTIVRCDTEAIQKGSKVDAIDEKGQLFALPDGNYTSPEGVKFTVESGYVKDVEAAAPDTQAAETQDTPPAENADMAKVMEAVAALQAKVAELEAKIGGAAPAEDMNKIAQVQEAHKKEFSEMSKTFAKFFELVEEMATQGGEPTNKPADKTITVTTTEDKVAEFRNQFLKEKF